VAVNPRDVGITREVVSDWFREYLVHHKGGNDTPEERRTFFEAKLAAMQMDVSVNTVGNDSLGDSTALVDLILDDLSSYE
jgi:hypothetical protein